MLWTLVPSQGPGPEAQGLTVSMAPHSQDSTHRVLLPGVVLPHSLLTTQLGCRYSRPRILGILQ